MFVRFILNCKIKIIMKFMLMITFNLNFYNFMFYLLSYSLKHKTLAQIHCVYYAGKNVIVIHPNV